MRHVNPVRQSGPLPSYYGSYTMEDIKKLFDVTSMNTDTCYCQMDVDEVMRRVPGVYFGLVLDYAKISRTHREIRAQPNGTSEIRLSYLSFRT
jgi:hypothetical protein